MTVRVDTMFAGIAMAWALAGAPGDLREPVDDYRPKRQPRREDPETKRKRKAERAARKAARKAKR